MSKFWKFQGAGNDFIVLDRYDKPLLAPERVIEICRRHLGIGANGVLSLRAGTLCAVEMVVQNSDGTIAGMCGNGIRCVFDAVWRGYFPWINLDYDAPLDIQVGSRVFTGRRIADGRFDVKMGKPDFTHADLPSNPGDSLFEVQLESGRAFEGWLAHYGNPHFVTLTSEDPMALAEQVGAQLEGHSIFPDRSNISFVRDDTTSLTAVVFERGVGITQACGTGACAIALSAIRSGLRSFDEPVAVQLPGGKLRITIAEDFETTMEGPSRLVFSGESDRV